MPTMSAAISLRHASLALAIGAAIAIAGCGDAKAPERMEVRIGETRFDCKLSLDDATRQRGLGGVASLAPSEGMLFAFPDSDARNFFMRDCLMDIDIAFIDPFGFVTATYTMPKEDLRREAEGETEQDYLARLKRYPSIAPAQFALEVAPGTLAPLGVRRGTKVEFDRDLLKRHAR